MNKNQTIEEKRLRSLLDIIQFMESVAAQLYSCENEDRIISTIHETSIKSRLYTTVIGKLDETGDVLQIVQASIPKKKMRMTEKIGKFKMDRMSIPLKKSKILSRVVRDGETMHFDIRELVSEIFPRRLVSFIWKTMGFKSRTGIVTPLKKYGRTIGVLSISSPEMVEEFIPSVLSFARHISTALELMSDHAEYNQVEKALRTSENRYRKLFEQSNDAIFIHDFQGNLIDVNQRGMELLGCSVDELMRMPITMLHPETQLPIATKGLEETRQHGFTRFESQFKKADGSIIDVEISSRIVDHEMGIIQGVVRDITQRKKAEQEKDKALEAVRESEKRFRLLFENAISAIAIYEVILDEKGCVINAVLVAASPSFEKHTGLRVADVIGKSMKEIYPGIEHTGLIRTFGQVALDGPPVTTETYLEPLAKWYYFNAYKTCPNRFALVFTDITERKQTEDKVRVYEGRYRILFEKSRDAIMTLEPPAWRFTTGNPATVEMFRAENEKEFITYTPDRLSSERQPDGRNSSEKAGEMIAKAMLEGSNFFEWTHKRIDGEEFPATVLMSRVEQGGKTFIQATVRDITAQKQMEREKVILEEKLHHGEKLRAIGELAGGIAHDFNNMLGAIAGYADLIDENNRDKNGVSIDTVLEKRVGVIIRAAKRTTDLIAKLLAFARRGKFRNEMVNVHEIINDVLSLLKGSADKKVVFKTALNAREKSIEGDASQLQNIVLNLALNACDAMNGYGGTLHIATDNEILAAGQYDPAIKAGDYIAVRIKDTGVGMDEKILSRIFEPFYSTKKFGEGTGLGLASVYGAVRSHNGCITVESAPGKGSTFAVYLPVLKNIQKSVQNEKHKKQLQGSGTILIIDDEKMVGEMVGEMLNTSGYTVQYCDSGNKGVTWFKEHKEETDLVIIDMVMPIMDGVDCFKKLKDVDPSVKVVLASGYSKNEKVQSLLDCGALDFIEKPISKEVLSFAVARAIRV